MTLSSTGNFLLPSLCFCILYLGQKKAFLPPGKSSSWNELWLKMMIPGAQREQGGFFRGTWASQLAITLSPGCPGAVSLQCSLLALLQAFYWWKWKWNSLNRVRLCDHMYCSPPGSSMEFSKQEYWGRLPFPSPGDLPDPGIKPRSPALYADSLPVEPPGWQVMNFLLIYRWFFLNSQRHECLISNLYHAKFWRGM